MKRGSLTLAIAGMALALAVPAAGAGTLAPGAAFQLAQAQTDDEAEPAHPGPGMMKPHMMDQGDKHRQHGQHMQKMCETADAHHVATLAFSEARLKLTEAQKPAWSKFVEAATAAHQTMIKLVCADMKDKPRPTALPERLARAEEMAKARLAHLQALRPALDELYKALTPEQQKVADTLPLGTPGHGQGGHGSQHGW